MKFLLIVVVFIFSVQWTVYAQQLPTVAPPNPEAVSLFRFQEYPVNYSTGLPDVGLSLFEMTSGTLKVPISIRYHSSGRKVYDETGAIGLGWTLFAGGMISRTVYGDPDDDDYSIRFPTPWKYAESVNTNSMPDADFLEGVIQSTYQQPYSIATYDTEYDVFSYSVNSLAGKFILRDVDHVKTPVLIPKKSYRVECHKTNVQFNINYFDYLTLTDDSGTCYRFGKSLKDGTEYYESSYGTPGKSSWLLTEIISADKIDTIFFKYKSFIRSKNTVSQQCTIIDRHYDCVTRTLVVEQAKSDDGIGTMSSSSYSFQRLVEIASGNGKVKFNLRGESDVVNHMEIFNSLGEIIKVVDFEQSQQDQLSDGNAPTQKLDNVRIKDANGLVLETYTFEYYPTVGTVNGRFRDLWGYYNASGNLLMRSPVPVVVERSPFYADENLIAGDETSDRTPSLEAKKSGVLRRIIFPTGGYTEFRYEHNLYMDPSSPNSKSCGGLRLAQTITSDSANNSPLFKTYTYGVNESGAGYLALVPGVNNMSLETFHQEYFVGEGQCATTCPKRSYRKRTYMADVLPIFEELHQKPVFYKEVTEYHGTLTQNTGKTVYTYDGGNTYGLPSSVRGLFWHNDVKYWRENSLISKTDFKRNGNTYDTVKQVKNIYRETVYPQEKITGLHVGKYHLISPLYWIDPVTARTMPAYYTYGIPAGCSSDASAEVFRYSDYSIAVGKKELDSTMDIEFDGNGNRIITTTRFEYNDNHLRSSQTVQVSHGEVIRTETKYPADFPADPVSQQMIARNMLDVPLEVHNFSDNIPVNSTKTGYRNWGGDMIRPETVRVRKGALPYETRLVFHSYDAYGNIASVSKNNGIMYSYKYGYNGQLPVAKISNAEPGDVFYTSFEDAEGNSGENDARTGRRSRVGGYEKNLAGLNNGPYELSYFSKSENTWTLVQQNSIIVSNGRYSIRLTGQIDEVRFAPVDSQWDTYSFDPLTGQTSITDCNNKTTYFEYDSFQRLIQIKNDEKNIVKQFYYQYKQ